MEDGRWKAGLEDILKFGERTSFFYDCLTSTRGKVAVEHTLRCVKVCLPSEDDVTTFILSNIS